MKTFTLIVLVAIQIRATTELIGVTNGYFIFVEGNKIYVKSKVTNDCSIIESKANVKGINCVPIFNLVLLCHESSVPDEVVYLDTREKFSFDVLTSPNGSYSIVLFTETIVILKTKNLRNYLKNRFDKKVLMRFDKIKIKSPPLHVVSANKWMDCNNILIEYSGSEYSRYFVYDLKRNEIYLIGYCSLLNKNKFVTEVINIMTNKKKTFKSQIFQFNHEKEIVIRLDNIKY